MNLFDTIDRLRIYRGYPRQPWGVLLWRLKCAGDKVQTFADIWPAQTAEDTVMRALRGADTWGFPTQVPMLFPLICWLDSPKHRARWDTCWSGMLASLGRYMTAVGYHTPVPSDPREDMTSFCALINSAHAGVESEIARMFFGAFPRPPWDVHDEIPGRGITTR